MRKKIRFAVLFLTLSGFLFHPSAFAYWVWSPEAGKFVNPEETTQDTPQELYDHAMEFYKQKNLKETTGNLRLLLKKYPGAQIAPEAQYRLGTLYEERGDYARAFRAYRDLLQRYPQSERMNEVLEREFRIGNLFLSGRRAKLLGFEILPARSKAIEIFKHIVEVAPYSEYGDRAQFHLGLAYKKSNQFEESIQAFQALIDQYPSSKLVAQAQFQIADTSYLQTVAATRDQRVMDRATKEIDRFLKQYPTSSVSDKAARLRQEIDEKNAEKNYRVGLFYEKENFLDSAFIYYRDVSERYPQTQWGGKAKERLQALEKPAEYLKSQEQEAALRKEKLLSEIEALGSSDEARKKDLEWQLKRVEKEEKEIQKSKPATLKRRLAGLHQKERELREKEKALAKKRRLYAKNLSDDLAHAFDRWQASLEQEKADLIREKLRIKDWEKSLGVHMTPPLAQLVPFGKEAPSPVEQVQRLEAKRIETLAEKKKNLYKKKEGLYRNYEKLLTTEGGAPEGDTAYEKRRKKLEKEAAEIEGLEKELEKKSDLFKKHFGTPAWQAVWQVPKKALGHSAPKDWEKKSAGELQILQSQWQEKIASQKKLVDSIAQAFDQELSHAEEKRLTREVTQIETDPAALRRAIKQMEREIRSRYNEIQDRNDRKNELLEELDRVMHGNGGEKGKAAQSSKILSAPFRGSYWLGRSFLFGLPARDVKLTQEAKRISQGDGNAAQVRSLQEEIELESVLIDARNREIEGLTRELEALRARASLSGGPPSRSLLIKFPYVFVREAVVSANRLVPKRDRKERLINELNRETERLEQLKKELQQLERLLEEKGKPQSLAASPESAPNRASLQTEIRSLQRELELKKENYEYERGRFEKTRWSKLSRGREKARTEKRKAIEEHLIRLIEEEQKIEQEEEALLAKKKEMVEQFLHQLPSDLFAQELHLEKQEIESQLNEVQKRQTSLGEELRRFRPQAFPPN